MRWRESFEVLREAGFRWFFLARLVSTTGSVMAPIALAFAVLDLSDSAADLGMVLAARSIPLVLFLLMGGVIADRVSRTKVMQWSNLLSALSQGSAAALVISGHAHLWHLIVLEAINGTVSAASLPAMSAVVPQLVPRAELQRANVLLSMTRGGLAVVGPSIAALLVVSVGPGWALAVDATTWLIASLCLTRVRIPPRVRTDDPPSMLRDLKEGWSVFTGYQWLWVVVLAFGALNAIHAGAWFTLGPALAKQTIGEDGWGFVVSSEAVGLLVMTVLLLRFSFTRPLLAGMLGMCTFAAPLLMLGIEPVLVPLMLAAFVAGMGMEAFTIGWSLAMQENIPESVLSRAYSYDALGSFVAIPVGQVLYGTLGERLGYEPVLVISAVVYACIALAALLSPSVRRLRHGPAGPAAEPGSP